ncbi:hybrid sensor histidine kinase/response regulator, partial [Echinicola sediminis]
MRFRSFKWFLFVLLISITESYGLQIDEVNNTVKFKNISLKDGLSQSSVLSIYQDSHGFLWFGTRDGLNKYDGNQFVTFRYNYQDSTSLSGNIVKSIFQDPAGVIWVGTQNGINRYNPEEAAFQRIRPHQQGDLGNDYNVTSIVSAGDHSLYIGTDYGLICLDSRSNQYVPISNDADVAKELAGVRVRSLFNARNGGLWIKTLNSIYFFDPKGSKLQKYENSRADQEEKNENRLSSVFEDSQGNVWVGVSNGLTVLRPSSDTFRFFEIDSSPIPSISSAVRIIREDYQGNIWVGTYDGIYIINKQRDRISYLVHDENNPNSLSQNSIYSIFEDNKKDMWIGTYAGGVNHYDRSYDLFRHITAGTNDSKLNYKVISSIVEDESGDLWIGTEGGGINYYQRKTGKFSYFTHREGNEKSLSTNNVKAMIQDHQGNFWIGTHDGGLNFFDPNKRPYQFKRYKHSIEDRNSLSDNRVISLYEDDHKKIWIGTSGGGLDMLDPATGIIERIPDPENNVSTIIFSIIPTAHRDTVLIGGDRGVVKFNVSTKEFVPLNYMQQHGREHSAWVLSLHVEENGQIWVGTEGEGVFSYDPKSQSSVQYGVKDGLPNGIIFGIVPDNDNHLWFSTNKGLSRMNLLTKKVKNFDASDGLQSNEFNYGAYLKNKRGELFFGGANGLNIFNPDQIKENAFIPPVAITSISVHNKPYLNITDAIERIDLAHNQDVINMEFVALSYSQPEKNQYAYMLEGFDSDWNYIGNKHAATYTNLDAGDYVFKVKASNNDGLWNEKGASLSITVKPAPWKSWWAYLIYSVVLIAIVMVIRHYVLIRIRERNELREERLAKERIEEVNQLKLQLFTNISHDFRTPLTLIIGPLERLIKNKMGDQFIQGQHQVMFRNASVLMQLINELLDFRKNEAGKLQLQASKNNIVTFIREVKEAFDEIARAKNIKFELVAENEAIELWFDKLKLQKVLFNLLSNAFKFTPEKGTIQINIEKQRRPAKRAGKGNLLISIQDNGDGIPEENVKHIFDRFYQFGDRLGSGIGLALSKSIVELHQGSIRAESELGKGTKFEVRLPLGKKHLLLDQIALHDASEDELLHFDRPVIIEELIEEETNEKHSSSAADGRFSLLVVEDNHALRKHICSIFEEEFHLYEASNGEEGLSQVMSHQVDLVISDVMMPKMDGMEFCHAVKSNIRTSHIPVILLTAKTSENYQKSGYKIGADAYITKPFDAEILSVRVSNLIKSRISLIEKFKKDLILQPKEITTSSADEEFLKNAISIVEENMQNTDFNGNAFVSEMGMSRSVIYRKLKDLTDQSISEFIRTIKLKRVAQLLKGTQRSISEIAFDLGF